MYGIRGKSVGIIPINNLTPMIKLGKAAVFAVIASSLLLASCSMPWSKDDAGADTGKTTTSTQTGAKVEYKQFSDDELSKMKPEDLVLRPEDAQNEAKRAEFKSKIEQYRNHVLKKVAFKDESGFKGPEDIKAFLKTKGFKFDNSEFSFSSDLGGYTYLSQSGSSLLGVQYGSRQWETINEYVSHGTLEKRPELKKVFAPSYGIELGLDDKGVVTTVTEKQIDPTVSNQMEDVQKQIMKLNMELSGRQFGDAASSASGTQVIKQPTPEEMKTKYEEIRKLEQSASGLREKIFVVGAQKTDSPIVGKKIWEFSVK